MSRYQPYPSYKDSGVEWLGDMPEGWKAWKLAHAFNIGSGTTPKSENQAYYENGTIPWLNTGDLNDNSLYDCNKKITKIAFAECGLKIYPENSLAIAMYGATIGKLSLLKFSTTVNQACCVFSEHEKKIQVNFLFYCLLGFRQHIISLAIGGGQPNINQDILKNFKIASPSISEQSTIANFLDRETAKIDTLITKQERMIELLNEKRSAIISHAVTKGLDPDVPMKNSGAEWLGEVPRHWIRSNIGFETIVKARLGWKGLKAEEYVEDGYVFLATPNIKNSEIDFKNVNYITQERYEESPEIMLEEGDVLVTKDGSTTGTTNVVRELPRPATVNSSIAVIRPKDNIDSLYLYYFFISTYIQETINLMRGGMGVPHLFQGDLRKFDMLVPPKVEQKQIADYLDAQTAKIDTLVAKARQAIELMKERRIALISAAVTGKIDVRGIK